jgi:maltose O-acetyltransferase
VQVITRSHGIFNGPGILNPTIDYGVTVEANAWIGSFCVLAGCRIGADAVVAVGSVVRGQVVGPGVLVAGNPARVIARWNGSSWIYLPFEESGYQTRLS